MVEHDPAGRSEPLNIRCARVLNTLSDGHALRREHAEGCSCAAGDGAKCSSACAYVCADCGSRQPAEQKWDRTCAPPYGEDTPAGWAFTGPLVERFCLDVQHDDEASGWHVTAWDAGGYSRADARSACAAIAEWVAEHGAKEPAC